MNMAEIRFPEWAECLFRPARYKIIHGGRGSGKSWAVARALILLAASRKLRMLCTREFQEQHQRVVPRIAFQSDPRHGTCTQVHDSAAGHLLRERQHEFLFVGAGNSPEKIMSMEGVDICWVEQAERLSERSFEILLPTVRQPGSEVWCTFNPDEESTPVWRRFVATSPPGATVKQVNWQHNPWFPPELERERAYLYSVDPETAEHIWGGHPRTNQSSQVFKGKYVVESFTPPMADGEPVWSGPYYGCDFGFANDPTTLLRCWIAGAEFGKTQGKLMIEYEGWGIGVEITNTPRLFDTIPGAREHLIYADNSRPETISHIRNAGFRIEPCEKWSGSVEDGVSYMRSFERIIVHPRCPRTIEEMRLYSYKVDRLSGIVMPQIADRNNHCMDALRYALGTMIQPTESMAVWERLGTLS